MGGRAFARRAVGLVGAGAAAALALMPDVADAAPKPDLRTTVTSVEAATVEAGAELAVADTARNFGAAAANPSTTRYYVSRNKTKGQSDTRLRGKRPVDRLPKGDESSGEEDVSVPLHAPLGDVFLIACADDRRKVEESKEGNNCRATPATISIELPADCTDALTALGISFGPGPASPGVADPVTVDTPINGITYSNIGGSNLGQLYMDCTLALALHEMGEEMAARGLTHVQQGGIYAYRCIGNVGTPPDCPQGISQHAYATAIDILELRGGGTDYNVNDDWMIDPDTEPTCSAPTSGPKDQLMHEFVCALHAPGTFHIVLTPNYNADHRNHFHLDLTPEASFIE